MPPFRPGQEVMHVLPDTLPPGWGTEPGWNGIFTRLEAQGALPNGTRVMKTGGRDSDGHTLGATGHVLGSTTWQDDLMYFVEWDDQPRTAVGIMREKVTAV